VRVPSSIHITHLLNATATPAKKYVRRNILLTLVAADQFEITNSDNDKTKDVVQ